MSDFKSKMHEIQFRLRLRPRPRWGPYSAPPDPLAGFKGPTFKGREGKSWEWEGKGKGRRGNERGREGGEGNGGMEEKGRAPTEMKVPNQNPKCATAELYIKGVGQLEAKFQVERLLFAPISMDR